MKEKIEIIWLYYIMSKTNGIKDNNNKIIN